MRQDLRSFLKSKTNVGALMYFGACVYGYHMGQMEFATLLANLGGTLTAIGFRDKLEDR